MILLTYFRVSFHAVRIVILAAIGLVIIIGGMYLAQVATYFGAGFRDSSWYIQHHQDIVDRYYQSHRNWKLSKLGEVLYKNKQYPEISKDRRNKTFIVWKKNHKAQTRPDLNVCSVNNCVFTGDETKLQSADAVIVRLQLGKTPSVQRRNPRQIWMFLNDESPKHVFGLSRRKVQLSELHNVFNWSLTYRSDADVPVPYGRTVALKTPKISSPEPLSIARLVPNWKDKKRDVFVAILISNCGVSYRMALIKNLKEYIDVDVHGKCGDNGLKNSCPGHFRVDCKIMSQYLFYLVLENSKCKEYMTEKLFYNAYLKGAIPIIQGPSLEECKEFLPPDSYLHVDNYVSLEDLASDVVRISENEKELFFYHKWRNHFEVINEHGYFGVKPLRLCRVCEALNYNDDTESVYTEQRLREFLDPALCRR